MSSNYSVPATTWSPSKARHEFRINCVWEGRSSSGLCRGYLQANLAVLPSLLADQFETFCNLNRAPCPLLYKSKPGEVSAGFLARHSDVRTDIAKYCVSEYGILTKETRDLTAYSWDDFVSFYLGCSFSFEDAIVAAGIPIQNVAENLNFSMYQTNIPCIPVGPFSCNMVVSMRLFSRELVEKVVTITAAYDSVHGAPIHIGDPSGIGIKDIGRPDFGQAVDIGDLGDLVPVFWACGVTSSLAVRSACPKLSFSHSPGFMFISDTTVDEYFQNHGPEHGNEQPRLVILSDKPFLASLCSASALLKVEELATKFLHGPSSNLLKIALRLSHAPSVVIGFVGEQESLSCDTTRSDHIQGFLALVKALQVLKKKVTLVTEHSATLLNSSLSSDAAKGILRGAVRIVESHNTEMKGCLFEGEINHRLDTIVMLQSERERVSQSDEKEFLGDWVDKLFQGVTGCKDRIVMVKIMARNDDTRQRYVDTGSVDSHAMTMPSLKVAGHILAAALYVLNQCPIHSRYVRRGLGKKETFQVEQFLQRSIEQGEDLFYRIETCIQEDHIKA